MIRSPSPSPRPLLLLLDSRRHDGLEERSEESLGLLLNGRGRRRRGGGGGHGVRERRSVVRERAKRAARTSEREDRRAQRPPTPFLNFKRASRRCQLRLVSELTAVSLGVAACPSFRLPQARVAYSLWASVHLPFSLRLSTLG
jgi:hypothetical protein